MGRTVLRLQDSFGEDGNNTLLYLVLHMFKLKCPVENIGTRKTCVNQQSPSFTTGCFFSWVGSKMTPFFRAPKTNCGTSNQSGAHHSILRPATGFQQSHSVGSCPSCRRQPPATGTRCQCWTNSEREEQHPDLQGLICLLCV